jgi:hypothetical protein
MPVLSQRRKPAPDRSLTRERDTVNCPRSRDEFDANRRDATDIVAAALATRHGGEAPLPF